MSTHKMSRSFTGNHPLLPAMRPENPGYIPKVPTYTFFKWSFGRGSVIWKIWPAVLLHTLFATFIVWSYLITHHTIKIPNVMLTVMGVVIGFVISYRAISGYDRYWMGRTAWTDVIRNARSMGRLIWYHVPPRLTPLATTTGPIKEGDPPPDSNASRSPQELAKVMAEKKMALDLVEAYAVALKHHLRGEVGIYYQDLYDLIRPLHDFTNSANPRPTVASALHPTPLASSTAPPPPPPPPPVASTSTSTSTATASGVSPSEPPPLSPFFPTKRKSSKHTAIPAGHASTTSIHRPLLPASDDARREDHAGVFSKVDPDVIPFAGLVGVVVKWVKGFWKVHKEDLAQHARRGGTGGDRSSRIRTWSGPVHPTGVRELEAAEKGENLPEEILRCLSEWVSVLEERGTVPGASLGAILGGITQFEMSLTTLEHILTTPLPFVYSVHIRYVVWLYLFLLPLQLVDDFQWHTVPAVCIGAFVYLGFIAAGEEIEQPFGYDDNDLDMDMFCRDIISQDLHTLKKTPCLNAWFPPQPLIIHHPAADDEEDDDDDDSHGGVGGIETMLSPEHAYGGNLYRASLATLSDDVLVSGSDVESDEGVTETETETETEGAGDTESVAGRRTVEEGELVDVR
ncbi:Bestrophin, RFP-TM, chloride channel-domain-containing protein [Favolaschia claudopus]|uniref:Bestrophin, RFP-TM, chloride channel-domain-containing protein n=1 Tax=Favolaschia claudopus TaxID=2862362 RepID=A0AAW0CB95_9AGAR